MTRVSLGRQLQQIREPSMARSCHNLSMFVLGANLGTTCSLAYTDRVTHLTRLEHGNYLYDSTQFIEVRGRLSKVVSGRPCPSTARDLRIAPLIRRQGHIAGLAWDLAVNNSVSGRLGSQCCKCKANLCPSATSIAARHVVHSGEKLYTSTAWQVQNSTAWRSGMTCVGERPHAVAGSLRGCENSNCAA